MRYRQLDADGDYSFGRGSTDFHRDTPETVAQAVLTRLKLLRGEWFIDTSDGTPWQAEILGEHTRDSYDMAIRSRILGTPGVTQIDSYSSSLDPDTRRLSVTVTITTDYGQATFSENL